MIRISKVNSLLSPSQADQQTLTTLHICRPARSRPHKPTQLSDLTPNSTPTSGTPLLSRAKIAFSYLNPFCSSPRIFHPEQLLGLSHPKLSKRQACPPRRRLSDPFPRPVPSPGPSPPFSRPAPSRPGPTPSPRALLSARPGPSPRGHSHFSLPLELRFLLLLLSLLLLVQAAALAHRAPEDVDAVGRGRGALPVPLAPGHGRVGGARTGPRLPPPVPFTFPRFGTLPHALLVPGSRPGPAALLVVLAALGVLGAGRAPAPRPAHPSGKRSNRSPQAPHAASSPRLRLRTRAGGSTEAGGKKGVGQQTLCLFPASTAATKAASNEKPVAPGVPKMAAAAAPAALPTMPCAKRAEAWAPPPDDFCRRQTSASERTRFFPPVLAEA